MSQPLGEPLLEADVLARHYEVRRGLFGRPARLKAVDGVSFALPPGRTLGLVGESGCGKSTTAKLVLGLVPPTRGAVRFAGQPLPPPRSAPWRASRRRMQLVPQDPLAALDRRIPVGRQIEEPLAIHGIGSPAERRERVEAILDAVGLKTYQAQRYPHELSGGQRQRVVLARALILDPKLLVCDEPISALDVSIQAQIINLLLDLQERLGLAYLFISHDLKVVRQVSHEVAVMYLGRIVEQGDPDLLYARPAHPYTRALVSAIPSPRRRHERTERTQRLLLPGSPPNPIDVPPGCAFHPRCPIAIDRCRIERPSLVRQPDGRLAACHRAEAVPLMTMA